ncbi:MAG: serine hydrolase domain-containing protein, partial [Woeseiaceae bacterium]|nr:serine hydrolase domain-containing protein [Woeseiaceae bacterium]
MRLRDLFIALCLCSAAATASADPDATSLSARLAAMLDEFRGRYGFPGATAAVVLADGRLETAASGFADVEARRRMTPATPMLAASIGKTFVAATVLALESEGRLSRADLLAEYLGDRPWFAGLPNAGRITIGHLVRHESGLPDYPQLPAFQAAFAARIAEDARAFTPEEILGFVAAEEPLFEPGEGWAYSDSGYILLGLVIEAVTGRPYYAVVRELFLEPLDLQHTVPSDRRDIRGLAVGYTVPGNPFGLPERTADAEGRLLWDPAVEWTGGGLASTSGDLARWGHALFGGKALPMPYLDRLLAAVPVAADSPDILYGAGVTIYAHTAHGPVYGHGGWIPGFVSSLRHYPDSGLTVAFQVNTDAGTVDDSSDLVP